MSDFYDFEWGKDGDEAARRVMQQLAVRDENIASGVRGVLLAAVVTARGRRLSPSSIFEEMLKSRKRTSPYLSDKIIDAWNIYADQQLTTGDRVDVLVSLINPRHRNKTGISETLRYQLTQTYESLLDLWATVGDYLTGFRSMVTKVFGVGEAVGVAEYLHRGMTRGQLLAAFGHQLKSPDEPADDNTEES